MPCRRTLGAEQFAASHSLEEYEPSASIVLPMLTPVPTVQRASIAALIPKLL
jgi:hypothetical protein